MENSKTQTNFETTRVTKKNEFGIITIEIEKEANKPLGFYISKNEKGVFIDDIKFDTLKALLCKNDEIIKINGKIIKNTGLEDVVGLLSSMNRFTLTLKRCIETDSKPKAYDIINGKVDQTYSHKLFINAIESSDEEDDEPASHVHNLFNYYSNSPRKESLIPQNFTSEEYNNWISRRLNKSASNDYISDKNLNDLKLKFESLVNKRTASIENTASNYASSSLKTNEKLYIQVPKPINTLTTAKKQQINEHEFVNELNKNFTNNRGKIFDGYLNVFLHYACIDMKYFNLNEKNKFYVILRADQQPFACTGLSLQANAQLTKSYFMLEFNEQFSLNLNSNEFIDFIICSQTNDEENDEDLINIESIFFSFKFNFEFLFSKQHTCKLCVHLKKISTNTPILFTNMSADNANSQQTDAYLYVTLNYLKEFSLINQIFSSKVNSKLLATSQIDNKFYLVVRKLIYEIETRGGLYEPYLYQINVCLGDIKWILLQLERGCIEIIQTMPDIHVISSKNNSNNICSVNLIFYL